MIRDAFTMVACGTLIAGCASVPPDAGFADVKASVERRTGRHVQWNGQSADDRAVDQAVAGLLAGGLTADAAVQVALLNDRVLQATYERLGVAQADVVQAGLLRNPVFSGDIKFLEGGNGQIVDLAVAQDFLDLLFIPMRRRVAAAAFEVEKLRVTGAVLDRVGEVREAFYEHAAAEQTLELRRGVAEAGEASYELASRMRAAGNLTALDLANERASREQSKLDVARAESAVLETRERLNVLMGLWGTATTWSMRGRLGDPPADELPTEGVERRAVTQSVALAIGRHQIEAAAVTLGVRRSFGLLPEAQAGVAAERDPGGPWAVGPAWSLPIPLFDQGQARTAAARAELERERQQYVATAVAVRSAARLARDRLLAARSRAEFLKKTLLPLRQEVIRQTQLQYNAMLVGAFQLFQAKQAEIESGVEYVQALRDYWVARGRLEQVLGGAPGGGSAGNDSGGR